MRNNADGIWGSELVSVCWNSENNKFLPRCVTVKSSPSSPRYGTHGSHPYHDRGNAKAKYGVTPILARRAGHPYLNDAGPFASGESASLNKSHIQKHKTATNATVVGILTSRTNTIVLVKRGECFVHQVLLLRRTLDYFYVRDQTGVRRGPTDILQAPHAVTPT
jgi:hypothetical protein